MPALSLCILDSIELVITSTLEVALVRFYLGGRVLSAC